MRSESTKHSAIAFLILCFLYDIKSYYSLMCSYDASGLVVSTNGTCENSGQFECRELDENMEVTGKKVHYAYVLKLLEICIRLLVGILSRVF